MKYVLSLVALLLMACESGAGTLPMGQVALHHPDGTAHVVYDVELALTPATRARGLMYRRQMPAAQGMLFVWPEQQDIKMWMKNTLIPLDMLFIRDNKVVAVIENVQPQDLTPRGPGVLVDKVLELNAGQAAQYGLSAGWTIELETALPIVR